MTAFNAQQTKHPGEYLKEEMETRGWFQRDLAFILGCHEASINTIIAGKRGISPEMAKALAVAFNKPAEYFADLQKAYELAHAQAPNPGVTLRARMQNRYPVREMIRRGWIDETDAPTLEMQLARFFGVRSADEIPYLAHAPKKSNYEAREVPPAQLAWLFRVRQIAKSISVQRYSERALREALPRLQNLLSAPEEARHVPRILMECGMRFIIVETLPHAKIDGVCFWLDKNAPVIGMSIRYDRIDNFWFILRHEIEHVLQKHGLDKEVIDAELEGEQAGTGTSIPEEERLANAAAGNFCVPADKIDSFMRRKHPLYYEKDVLAFARLLNTHPGVIVGQMQYRLGRYDYLKKYLVKIRQCVLPGAMVDGWGQTVPITI
jgi:HTH-type transcriptional regulator / antitoxin HigA